MGGYLDALKVLVLIAFRNLFASRLKTLIVGGIILFGSMLVVVGTALVDSLDTAMSRSVIGSVAGHIQVYSAESKDELAVMGSMGMENPDLAVIEDFAVLKRACLTVPNVREVVPMGLASAIVVAGNTVDVVLEKLRASVRVRLAGGDDREAYESEKGHVRQIVSVLAGDLENVRKAQVEGAVAPEEIEAIARVTAPGFWDELDRDPLPVLEFLENRIAPLASDADMLFLRYMGTDPAAYQSAFDRVRIILGTPIPPGQRGFLFAQGVYEEQVKLKVALRLDKIRKGIVGRGRTIAQDLELQAWVRRNSAEVNEVLLQLDGRKTRLFRDKLQKELGSDEADVAKLLADFFRTNDGNFERRYRFFYDELAPSLELYRVREGDSLTIKSFTKGGYVQSAKLKVYGTFVLDGLEDSHMAGHTNLMDLVSFRELYGFVTRERELELRELKAAAGVPDVSRENAEAELFGRKDDGSGEGGQAGDAEAALRGLAGKTAREDRFALPFDPAELQRGEVLNAAVIVKDPRRIRETMRQIEAAGAQAGLPLRALDWQAAAGIVGQFVTMIRGVLYVSVLIIFAVALVIINNALVMATLGRVPEIGTLRAVGAQRRFLLGMLLFESLAVAVLFGGLGAALGAAIVGGLHAWGIPAVNEKLYFFFSGPRLHPTLGLGNVALALAIVLLVSALSSVYPGLLAMRVNPRQAMQTDE